MREAIRKCRKYVKHGTDKNRYEFLQDLVGKGAEPTERQQVFCDLYAEIVTVIANGKQPREVTTLLRDTELFARRQTYWSGTGYSQTGRPSSLQDIISVQPRSLQGTSICFEAARYGTHCSQLQSSFGYCS